MKWREVLSRLPLPMLALAAAYGVYSFAMLFVPQWVAIIQAAAFELTYCGLAVARLADGDRKRATAISVGAVVVSITYNTLAGLFHRNPEWTRDLWYVYEWLLAVLHGAPLAWVAYLVADLLLHTAQQPTLEPALALPRQETYPAPIQINAELPANNTSNAPIADRTCRHCGASGLTQIELMAHGRNRKNHGTCKR